MEGVFKPPDKDEVTQLWLEELQQRKNRPAFESVVCDRRSQSPPISGELENTCGIDLKTQVKQVQDSTMKILNSKGDAIGSGFYACSTDESVCAVVTNSHVARLSLADKSVYLVQGDKVSLGKVVKEKDTVNDLALIEVDTKTPVQQGAGPIELKPVEFADVKKDDAVFSSCYPTLGMKEVAINSGKVMKTDERLLVATGTPMLSPPSIVSDQVILGGCSGGANFNAEGKLIGIMRASGSEGTIIIKPKHAIQLLEEFKEKKALEAQNPSK